MSWLFDTCAVSAMVERRRKKSTDLVALWAAGMEEGICLSSVTVYELRRGIRKQRLQDRGQRLEVDLEKIIGAATVIQVDDFEADVWRTAEGLWARAQALEPSLLLGELDLLIAATAIATDRSLVTLDTKLSEGLARLGHAAQVRWIATPQPGE